jgi:hypothetical protein
MQQAWEMKNTFALFGKAEGQKKLLGRLTRQWEDNNKMISK